MNRAFAAVVCFAAPVACADVVFENVANNGFFTPFGAQTPPSVRYGDGGWLSGFTADRYEINRVTLFMCVTGSTRAGGTDITFTFNDGDPSGLVFGSGAILFSTTVTEIALPESAAGPVTVEVEINLPAVQTTGGFNNIGFSVGVANYDSDGQFGFQCSNAFGQTAGFYTNNASTFNGSAWSLFSFGPDPTTGVANFVVSIEGRVVPAPATLLPLALGLMGARRREVTSRGSPTRAAPARRSTHRKASC